jgi:hypothetical protein
MKKLICVTVIVLFVVSYCFSQKVKMPEDSSGIFSTSRGYITINEFASGLGLGETGPAYSKYLFGITTIHGYQVNKNFVVAGGTGALFYNSGTMIPAFLVVRYSFLTGKFTPYIYGDGGLLFNTKDVFKLFAYPGIGVRCTLNPKLALTFGAGVWVQADDARD